MWSLYFNVDNTTHRDLTSAVDNIVVVSGPDELIDYDNPIAEVTDHLILNASTCYLVKWKQTKQKLKMFTVNELMLII